MIVFISRLRETVKNLFSGTSLSPVGMGRHEYYLDASSRDFLRAAAPVLFLLQGMDIEKEALAS